MIYDHSTVMEHIVPLCNCYSCYKYLLLTKFEVRTVSYVPSRQFPVDLWYTDYGIQVSKIFIISLRLIRRAANKTSCSQIEDSGPY